MSSALDVFALPTHPACEIFPMLPPDELRELAADIRANGLMTPIVVGQHEGRMTLIDGKNRREACRIAGVTPKWRELSEGEDPVAFIWSMNIHRAHRTQGQRAMGFALIFPDPRRGRGHKDPARKGAEKNDLSYRRIKEARFVLRHLPELAKGVVAGAVSLDEAVKRAQEAKAAREEYELQLSRLKNWRPALADMVTEGTLSLVDALRVAAESDEQERRARHVLAKQLMDVTALAGLFTSEDRIDDICELLIGYPEQFEKSAELSVPALLRFLLEDAKQYGETLKLRMQQRASTA